MVYPYIQKTYDSYRNRRNKQMEYVAEKKGLLNANHIKLIAIIAMTLDHGIDLLFPSFPIEPIPMMVHLLGRVTAPIMWFFVCEGFFYTRNLKKYMLRMLVFAIISHFAYCFAFGMNPIPLSTSIFNQTSVMWALFLGIVVLWVKYKAVNLKLWQKTLITVAAIILAFPADWSCIAVLSIVEMYAGRGNLKEQMKFIIIYVACYALVSFFFVSKGYAIVQIGIILVYPILKQYNGERGKAKWMKWFFYIYYPLHLLIIGLIRYYYMGNAVLLF